MAREIRIDAEAIEEFGAAVGFLFAAFSQGFKSGADAFEIMQEEEAIKELHETDKPPAERVKTEISDCRSCWCDQCARLEECEKMKDGEAPDGIRPFPCVGCGNGMRFMPCEEERCADFVQGEGMNNG